MKNSNRILFSLIVVLMFGVTSFTVTADISDNVSAIAVENDDSVKSIAHRGYSAVAPENTLPSYQLAYDMGFEYVETDVAVTKDGKIVLLHDSTVDRTSNGSGSISNMTLEEVKELDFGSWKDPAYAGTTIPTLDEFLDLCRTLGLKPYIEFKLSLIPSFTTAQIKEVVDTVAAYGLLEDTTFISMDYDYLETIRDYNKNVRLGYIPLVIVTYSTIDKALDLRTGYNEVFIDTQSYKGNACELCRNAGLPLEVWTVDDPDEMESLNLYISGVTSNCLKYSDYRPVEYTVKFNSNGGFPVDDIKYTSKSEKIVLPESTRYGYTFNGWYANEDLSGERISSIETGSTGDMMLYAGWVAINYTVTFNTNGGSAVAPITYTADSGRIILPESTRSGYTLDGWYGNAELSGDKVVAIEPGSTGDMTLYAKWEQNAAANDNTLVIAGAVVLVLAIIICVGVIIWKKRSL